MIKALAHVCILSSDLDRTLDFYCGTLELRRKFDFVEGEELIGFYLEVGRNQFIEVFKDRSGNEAGPQDKRIKHFCLEVEDIDAARDRLLSKGIAVTDKKKGNDASWQIWCKDPDGIDVEFHQYNPDSSQVTGARCHVNR